MTKRRHKQRLNLHPAKIAVIALVISAGLLAAVSAFAGGRGNLRVITVDDGKPLGGVALEVSKQGSKYRYTDRTKASGPNKGQSLKKKLPTGTYVVDVACADPWAAEKWRPTVKVAAGKTTTLRMEMRPSMTSCLPKPGEE